MPQVPRRSWWHPRRHPGRSPACRRHHRQEPWKRHGPDHQLDALLACRFVGCHGDHGLAVLVHAGKSHHDRSIFAELAAHVEHGLAQRVERSRNVQRLLGDLDRSRGSFGLSHQRRTEAASWDSYIAARRRSDSLSLASSMFTRSASSSGRALTMSESWETSACSRALNSYAPWPTTASTRRTPEPIDASDMMLMAPILRRGRYGCHRRARGSSRPRRWTPHARCRRTSRRTDAWRQERWRHRTSFPEW